MPSIMTVAAFCIGPPAAADVRAPCNVDGLPVPTGPAVAVAEMAELRTAASKRARCGPPGALSRYPRCQPRTSSLLLN